MKKTLLVLMATALIVCCTACGGDSSTEASKKSGYVGETYSLGETVSTSILEFTLDRADLAIAMINTLDESYALPKEYNPEEDSKNPLVAPKGSTFVPITFTVKNLDRTSLDLDFADVFSDSEIKIIYNDNTYNFDGHSDNDIHYCYELFEDGGYDKYEYGNILLDAGEKNTFRAYLKLPVDVEDLNSDFIIVFGLPDINSTFVEYAYKVTGEARAEIVAKDLAAAEEKRKRIEEMNAIELAEIDEESKIRLTNAISNWGWDYTGEGNTSYNIRFVDNTNITVKLTVGNESITNSGTYSVRNKVIYIQYDNGGEAKIPYVEHDGSITVFPIVGMDKSGTFFSESEITD